MKTIVLESKNQKEDDSTKSYITVIILESDKHIFNEFKIIFNSQSKIEDLYKAFHEIYNIDLDSYYVSHENRLYRGDFSSQNAKNISLHQLILVKSINKLCLYPKKIKVTIVVDTKRINALNSDIKFINLDLTIDTNITFRQIVSTIKKQIKFQEKLSGELFFLYEKERINEKLTPFLMLLKNKSTLILSADFL